MCRRNWNASSTSASKKIATLRYQHASDIRTDLQRLKRDTDSGRVTSRAEPAATTRRNARKVIVPAAAALLALFVAGYFYFRTARQRLTDKDTIVLADFTNTTGDPVFDETLRQGLVGAARTIAVPQPRFRRANPADARL